MSAAALRDVIVRSTPTKPPRFEVRKHGEVLATFDTFLEAIAYRKRITR